MKKKENIGSQMQMGHTKNINKNKKALSKPKYN